MGTEIQEDLEGLAVILRSTALGAYPGAARQSENGIRHLQAVKRWVEEQQKLGKNALDLAQQFAQSEIEIATLREKSARLREVLEGSQRMESLSHKRVVLLQSSMQKTVLDAPECCREWIHKRLCETWERLNALLPRPEDEHGPSKRQVGGG
jgi:hypothetical protein